MANIPVKPGKARSKKRSPRHWKAQKELGKIKSHFQRLNDQEKTSIRKLDFLLLPAELRNKVYDNLLICRIKRPHHALSDPQIGGRLPMEDSMLTEPEHFRLIRPHLGILGTCRTLRDEGRDYFYKENKLEVQISLVYASEFNSHFDRSQDQPHMHFLPDFMLPELHLPSISNFRILVVLEENLPAQIDIDWSVIGHMFNLHTLEVVLAFNPAWESDKDILEHDAEWKDSILFQGFVIRIMEYVPRCVTLKWDMWDTLATDFQPGGFAHGRILPMDLELIKGIARNFDMVRGRRSRRIDTRNERAELELDSASLEVLGGEGESVGVAEE